MRENRILELDEMGSFLGVDLKNDDAEQVVINVRGEELKISPDDARGLAKWLLKNLSAVDTTLSILPVTPSAVVTKESTVSTAEPTQESKEPQPKPGLENRVVEKTVDDTKKYLGGVQFHDYSNKIPNGGIVVKFPKA